jgi:hypothetical protein
MSKAIAVSSSEYRNLPIAQLEESPTNPRRRAELEQTGMIAASEADELESDLNFLCGRPIIERVVGPGKRRVLSDCSREDKSNLPVSHPLPCACCAGGL